MPVHRCVRVYANGEAKETARDPEGLASWLEANRVMRPGNALFVDGVCASGDNGYLNSHEVEGVAAILIKELRFAPAPTPARLVRGRYPDDARRKSFRLRTTPISVATRSPIIDEGHHVLDDEIQNAVPGT